MTGRFITFEGIDGSGKSTQARALAKRLEDERFPDGAHDIVLTREPGGAPGAENIRRLLVEGDPDRWSAETELLLFTAARRDHLERLIWPSLAQGKTVICDRFADSTRVYQGATRGNLRGLVDKLHDLMIAQDPDLTLIIDMDPQTALTRGLARGSGEDRFEDFGIGFQQKLRSGFRQLAADFPNRCKLIDGDRSVEDITRDVAKHVQQVLS